jgi:SAM-dependent methyltransferase
VVNETAEIDSTYEHFAAVYDAVMDDPRPKIARVQDFIDRYRPGASSLLELGCGTGTILAGLGATGSLSGIDRSPQMLELARHKVPRARLIEADITKFALAERFDVVICVFDTLNHLVTFDAWQAMFRCVDAHLAENGLFIFDVNTVAKLRGVAAFDPWVEEIDGATVIQNVEEPVDGVSIWNVWIVEHLEDGDYAFHHERIGELAVELPQIEAALSDRFALLETHDEWGAVPSAESERVHYCFARRAPG